MVVFTGLYESPGPPPSGDAMTTKTAIKVGTYYIFVLFAVALAAAWAIWSE
jgi:hypothetical protein